MPARPHLALALASVTILAGCGGFSGTGPSQMGSPTITAAPVPTDIPTPDNATRAVPGLTEDGISNAFELGRAHRAVLSKQSYTQRLNETTRFANGSLRLRRTSVVRTVPTDHGTRYLSETAYGGLDSPTDTLFPAADRTQLYGDERVHVRSVFPNGTTSVRSFHRINHQSHTMELVFLAFETRLAGMTACGNRSCHRVRSTALDSPGYLSDALFPVDGRIYWRNSSLLALVDDRGFVHEYRVRFTVETQTHTYTMVRRVRYSDLGETAVERPDWVPD